MLHIRRPFFTADRSMDECLRLWPTVAFRAKGRTHLAFADRIAHQSARPGWTPSPAQAEFIRKLVTLYADDDIALDPALVGEMEEVRGWTIE